VKEARKGGGEEWEKRRRWRWKGLKGDERSEEEEGRREWESRILLRYQYEKEKETKKYNKD